MLLDIQNRGQLSAGMTSFNPHRNQLLETYKDLGGVSEVFRRKVEACFSRIAARMAVCLEEARQRGDIPADSSARHMAGLLVDCWEGAALRSRLCEGGAEEPGAEECDVCHRRPFDVWVVRRDRTVPAVAFTVSGQ